MLKDDTQRGIHWLSKRMENMWLDQYEYVAISEFATGSDLDCELIIEITRYQWAITEGPRLRPTNSFEPIKFAISYFFKTLLDSSLTLSCQRINTRRYLNFN